MHSVLRRLLTVFCCAAVVTTATTAQTPLSADAAAQLRLFDEVWSTVNDNFYDPNFGGVNWAAVRNELRPKAEHAPSMDDARAVVREMLSRLKKSHLALLSGASAADEEFIPRGEAMPDVQVRVLDREVRVTRGSALLPGGSVVLTIDGRDVRPRAGESALLSYRRADAALHGLDGSTAVITYRAVGASASAHAALPRVIPPGTRVQFSNLAPVRVRVDVSEHKTPAGRRVGAIGFNIWMAAINDPVAEAVDRFRAADGLVIDLRGNPGGLAAMISNIAGHLIDSDALLGTMHTRAVPELKFKVNPRRSTNDGRAVTPFSGPVAVIVDELTASASECFAGALQDLGRVRVFGRTSMGAALPAFTKRLSNGDVLEYVVGDFTTSKGRSLEGGGVVPDETQPLTIAGLAAGRDEAMNAALAWIDRQHK